MFCVFYLFFYFFIMNFEILGVPIGDPIFCAKSIAEKRVHASKFLALLKEVGSVDSQVL